MNAAEEVAEENEVVQQFVPYLPDKMNKEEGVNFLRLLYQTGKLHDHLEIIATAADDDEEIGLEDFFNFDLAFYEVWDAQEIMIDPKTGRITYLRLLWGSEPYNLPPIIERLQSLESIELWDCQILPVEISNLKMLKSIRFFACPNNVFVNIPEGLRLNSVKIADIDLSDPEEFDRSPSSFLKIFTNTLERLYFVGATRTKSDEILHVLQHDELSFRQTLTTLMMVNCQLNEHDLYRLVFEFRSRLFTKLHTINVTSNGIKSLRGIVDKTKKLQLAASSSSSSSSSLEAMMPDNNLRTLDLRHNPVEKHMMIIDGNSSKSNITKDPKEKAAVLSLLDTFNGISNIGIAAYDGLDPDIEYVLRINHAGRKYMTINNNNNNNSSKSILTNRALWPLILERAYKKSDKICTIPDGRKCGTGMFHLIRYHYLPVLLEDHNSSTTTTTTTTTTNDIRKAASSSGRNNNSACIKKRKCEFS